MSANVDIVLAGFDGWKRQDLDAWLAVLHPDCEFHTSGEFPDFRRSYRGCEQLTEFWHAMHEPWQTFRIDVEATEEHGDWVLCAIRFSGQGLDSGLEVELEFANAIRVVGGQEVEIVARRSMAEAREVAAAT